MLRLLGEQEAAVKVPEAAFMLLRSLPIFARQPVATSVAPRAGTPDRSPDDEIIRDGVPARRAGIEL